jgi:hypothetical protein
LEVEFANGEVFQYFDVPHSVYEQFVVSTSKGKFVNDRLRVGRYRYRKVSGYLH